METMSSKTIKYVKFKLFMVRTVFDKEEERNNTKTIRSSLGNKRP